jgi:tRNA A37 methylthiotransferase MiaB
MKVAFFTIGCKVNQYETEAIAEKLEALGFGRLDFRDKVGADLINTYALTGKDAGFAERGAKPELLQLRCYRILQSPLFAFA